MDYYTGPIFEVYSEFGSLAGGGRYDRLIGIFTGADVPATGISLGPNRIVDVMKKENMFQKTRSGTQIFVVNIKDTDKETIKISEELRKEFSVETDVMGRNLRKQMEYANKKRIPIVVFVGKKEIQSKKVNIKCMETGKEYSVKIENLTKKIKKLLN